MRDDHIAPLRPTTVYDFNRPSQSPDAMASALLERLSAYKKLITGENWAAQNKVNHSPQLDHYIAFWALFWASDIEKKREMLGFGTERFSQYPEDARAACEAPAPSSKQPKKG